MTDDRHWIVTASGDITPDEVEALLTSEGFLIEQRLGDIGVFTGRANAKTANAIKGRFGIVDIVPDQPIEIGRPDAPVS